MNLKWKEFIKHFSIWRHNKFVCRPREKKNSTHTKLPFVSIISLETRKSDKFLWGNFLFISRSIVDDSAMRNAMETIANWV